MGTWATADDVQDLLGEEVTEAHLLVAQSIIEIYANRTYDENDAISGRDLKNLKQAVIWQAYHVKNTPGLTLRTMLTSVSQDGQIASFNGTAAQLLNGLAMRALKNLSWKANGSFKLSGFSDLLRQRIDFLNEESDVCGTWEPI